jgi:hypothetical protein
VHSRASTILALFQGLSVFGLHENFLLAGQSHDQLSTSQSLAQWEKVHSQIIQQLSDLAEQSKARDRELEEFRHHFQGLLMDLQKHAYSFRVFTREKEVLLQAWNRREDLDKDIDS